MRFKLYISIYESESEIVQLCPILCDSMDCSLPASSIHGISQARILEWVAISFSRGSSLSRDQTWVSCIQWVLYQLSHQGSPNEYAYYHNEYDMDQPLDSPESPRDMLTEQS